MADLIIRDEQLAWRLLDIARREKRPVEAVLESMVEKYDVPTVEETEPTPGTFAALAASALKANLASETEVDTSERTKEIMKAEYADHIRRKMDEQSDSD